LTSGLKDRAAGRKEILSEKWADLQWMEAISQGNPETAICPAHL
jgi:hypothetical protein